MIAELHQVQSRGLRVTAVLVPAVVLLWLAAIFDPVGNFLGIRFVALILALSGVALIGLPSVLSSPGFRLGWRESAVVCALLWLPGYGVLLYAMRGTDHPFTDTSYIAAGLLLTSTWLYTDPHSARIGIRTMIWSLRFLAAVVIAAYPILAFAADGSWLAPLSEGSVALFGFREYGPVTLPYIYFLASPMLVFLVAYEVQALRDRWSTGRLFSCSFAIFALGLSGTRAHLLIACFYLPVYFIATSRSAHAIAVRLVAIILLIATLIAGSSVLGNFFDTSETSNSMKLEALDRYAEIFSQPDVLFLGQGFNAHAWSAPLQEMIAREHDATKTELTYLELIRVFGLFGALPFYLVLAGVIFASRRLPRSVAWFRPAFVVSLLNSSLNPYLFSTNGMLPFALLLAILAQSSQLAAPAPATGLARP